MSELRPSGEALAQAETILRAACGDRVRSAFVLAPLTTFRIGGPAALFLEPERESDLAAASLAIRETGIAFAVLTALFSVVPYFGAIASGIPPVLFALTDSPGKALAVIIVYTLVQQFEGNVTIPLVMSRTVKLHPAVIAVGVVVVGQLFGFVGLIVAVPILSMITILVEELWVKPMENAQRLEATTSVELPPSAEPQEALEADAPRV